MKGIFGLLAVLSIGMGSADDSISLDQIFMNVVQTAPNGVVNQDTFFHFAQNGEWVTATYAGGRIRSGYLVGRIVEGNQLIFSYCQAQLDGRLDNGASQCEIARNQEGRVVLIEYFEWASRPGEYGTNVLQEYLPE